MNKFIHELLEFFYNFFENLSRNTFVCRKMACFHAKLPFFCQNTEGVKIPCKYDFYHIEDVKDLIKEGKIEIIIELWLDDVPISKIAKYVKMTEIEVEKIIAKHKNTEW